MTVGYELYSIPQAAKLLHKSDKAVRRLIKAGKLIPVREGRRYFLTPETLQKYAAGLPHPLKVMASMYTARGVMMLHKWLNEKSSSSSWMSYRTPEVAAYARFFLPSAVPICRELLEAVKVKDYARVEQQDIELFRVHSDYIMLHAPIKTPRAKPQQRERVHAEQLPLFPGVEGGQA